MLFYIKLASFGIVLSVYADDKEALYTRSQARKELKQYEKALEDANQLVNLSFNLKEYISDLNNLISKKVGFFLNFFVSIAVEKTLKLRLKNLTRER